MRFGSERLRAWLQRVRQVTTSVHLRISAAAAVVLRLLAMIEARDVALVIGLLLLGYGASLVYLPAGFLAPGLVLTWIGLPVRPRQIDPNDVARALAERR